MAAKTSEEKPVKHEHGKATKATAGKNATEKDAAAALAAPAAPATPAPSEPASKADATEETALEANPAAQRTTCPTPDDCAPGELPDEEILYDLADLFKIFSDTTRIKILFALMNGGLCVAHIAETVGASQSAVSHQLRILKQSRLVKFQRDGKNIIYSLSDDHVYTMLAQGMSHVCE